MYLVPQLHLAIMNLLKISLKLFLMETFALADMYIDIEEEVYEIIQHDEYFNKNYYEDIRHLTNNLTSFISTTIGVFHFDFLTNAYRSMTVVRQKYFIDQLEFEEHNLTAPAKAGTDKLITDRMVFVSHQALKAAVDNYLEILDVIHLSYKKYDARNKQFYQKQGNNFLDQFVQSPQRMGKDNCTIGLISTVGIQVKWKYPFKDEGQLMKAVGIFNFAHDLNLKVDILQIPFKGGEMEITIVISRDQTFYVEAQRLFQRAFLGKFRVQIDTVYLPKIAFSTIIKDFSIDREEVTRPINKYRCMTQKLVMNFNEEGISTVIKNKPSNKDWSMIDWKYGTTYYPPKNSCIVDSPFFFTVTYTPTREIVLMGRWRPESGPYVEETVYVSDDIL